MPALQCNASDSHFYLSFSLTYRTKGRLTPLPGTIFFVSGKPPHIDYLATLCNHNHLQNAIWTNFAKKSGSFSKQSHFRQQFLDLQIPTHPSAHPPNQILKILGSLQRGSWLFFTGCCAMRKRARAKDIKPGPKNCGIWASCYLRSLDSFACIYNTMVSLFDANKAAFQLQPFSLAGEKYDQGTFAGLPASPFQWSFF